MAANAPVKPARSKPAEAAEPAAPAIRIPAGSATDKVADAITQGIPAGVFVPWQHLLEPDLTRRLGISRGSGSAATTIAA